MPPDHSAMEIRQGIYRKISAHQKTKKSRKIFRKFHLSLGKSERVNDRFAAIISNELFCRQRPNGSKLKPILVAKEKETRIGKQMNN